MSSLYKRSKRGFRRRIGAYLERAVLNSPDHTAPTLAGAMCYAELLIMDFGVSRLIYPNRHRIGATSWRSAQPSPRHIGWYAKRGVRTVVNLRGDQLFGTRWLEERACRQHDLAIVNLKLRSRAAPTRAELHAARDVLASVEYPILIHCKSGADRAGLMSVLYRHDREGQSIREALRELHWRFGHVRHADTGILDHFFESYIAETSRDPMPFWQWVDTVYDSDAVGRSFRAKGWANGIVNTVLRRE